MNKRLIYTLFCIGIVYSCAQKSAESAEESCEKPVMYKTSELAQLMRDMYEDNDSIRQMIMDGNWPDSLPSYFTQIHTAEATNPSDINEIYKGMADEYLIRFDSLKNAAPEFRKDAYNHLVSGCISCHKVYCNGPIPKIQKLYIP